MTEKWGMEKRVFVRKILRTKVVFEDETGEGFIYFYSTDVSLGGLFLESDIPLKLGTQVFLSFTLGERGPLIRATARVVRLEKGTQASLPIVGMGTQFADLSSDAREAIQAYVGS